MHAELRGVPWMGALCLPPTPRPLAQNVTCLAPWPAGFAWGGGHGSHRQERGLGWGGLCFGAGPTAQPLHPQLSRPQSSPGSRRRQPHGCTAPNAHTSERVFQEKKKNVCIDLGTSIHRYGFIHTVYVRV